MLETLIQPRRRPRIIRKLLFYGILLIIFFLTFGFIKYVSAKKNNQVVFQSSKKNPKDLEQKIRKSVGNLWKNYSVLVVDYDSDFRMGINDSVIYTAASVNKVAIVAALYNEAEKNLVDFDKTLTLQKDDIQNYGTGSIRYDPLGTTYTIKTLAMLMMRQSDNTAAHLLATYILDKSTTQDLVTSWGLTQTDMEGNKTSNGDMSLLFEKIYQNQIASAAHTKELLNLLQESDFEDRLPASLPKGTVVYHKIGNEIGFIHDVGIVESGNRHYYIGVFTSDISNEPATVKKTAEISKIVYDYLL